MDVLRLTNLFVQVKIKLFFVYYIVNIVKRVETHKTLEQEDDMQVIQFIKMQFIAKNTHTTSYNVTGKKSTTIFYTVYYMYVLQQLCGDQL